VATGTKAGMGKKGGKLAFGGQACRSRKSRKHQIPRRSRKNGWPWEEISGRSLWKERGGALEFAVTTRKEQHEKNLKSHGSKKGRPKRFLSHREGKPCKINLIGRALLQHGERPRGKEKEEKLGEGGLHSGGGT